MSNEPVNPVNTDRNQIWWDVDVVLPILEEVAADCKTFIETYLDFERPDLKGTILSGKSRDDIVSEATLMAKKLIEEQNCPREVAIELSVLSLYDLVILLDDSTTMEDEENGERITTLTKVLNEVCKVYKTQREKGVISVRFLNQRQGRKDVKSAGLLKDHKWGGLTMIGTEMKLKILDKFVFGKEKPTRPLLVMTITDGKIEGEPPELLENIIMRCITAAKSDTGLGENAVSFHFSRVGNDPEAAKFLNDLDKDPRIRKYVSCLAVADDGISLERIEGNKWGVLINLLLGAISVKWNGRGKLVHVPDDYKLDVVEDVEESDPEDIEDNAPEPEGL